MRTVFLPLLLFCLTILPSYVLTQSFPASVPLAIRSPYFNCWNNGATAPMRNWPSFWNGAILGWAGLIRVDGTTYVWLGNPSPGYNLTTFIDLQVTPTRTIYLLQAGPSMRVNVTFMTPIDSDPVKQSMPFSYVFLDAVSTDGQPHAVMAYVDISGEWASGNRSEIMTWKTTKTDASTTHQIQLQAPTQFQESADQAEDTSTYLAMRSGPTVSSTAVIDPASRQKFSQGSLPDPVAQTSGPIANPFPVVAIAVDLGPIAQTSQSVVWALGVVRNPSIAHTTATGAVKNRVPYFFSKYPDTQSALDAFLLDFDDARNRSIALDAQLLNAPTAMSPTYANLVSLVARQTIAATELTIGNGTDGTWNTTDVMMFMKDVGTSRRVNPVEVIYASFPFFLSLNPAYAGLLLLPLFDYQSSSQYTQQFAATDLGDSYPQATGSNRMHTQGVEQTGNMLIMSLAHARTSGDGTLISQYYDLLANWTTYLIQNSLSPNQQSNADLEAQANMTNLAIKGIIGVRAMSLISQGLGKYDDSVKYWNASSELISQWDPLALSSDNSHVLATYGNDQSWTLPYNLYADRLLQSNIVSSEFYASETSFLKGLLSTAFGLATPSGIPIDTLTPSQADTAWTMFTAAIVTDPSVRDSLIQPLWTHITANTSTFPASKVYKLDSTGSFLSGRSSPGLGAVFAPLALNLPIHKIIVPIPQQGPKKSTSIVGPVVGGVVGGLGLIALIVLGIVLWRRWRKRRNPFVGKIDMDEIGPPDPFTQGVTIYSLNNTDGRDSSQLLNPGGRESREMITSPPITTPNTGYIASSKAREAEGQRWQPQSTLDGTPAPSAPSDSGSGSNGPGSSREPPTTVSSPITADVQGLRAEVDNLRRAMQEIQADRIDPAPPSYSQ